MLRKIISLAVIFSFVFSNIAFALPQNTLRQMTAEKPGLAKEIGKDLGGPKATNPITNQAVKDWIEQGKVVKLRLEDNVFYIPAFIPSYTPGKSNDFRRDNVLKRPFLGSVEVATLRAYLNGLGIINTDEVTIGIVKGQAMVNPTGEDQFSIAHAGEREKIIYIGEYLLRDILSKRMGDDPHGAKIFAHDVKHLTDPEAALAEHKTDEYKRLTEELRLRCEELTAIAKGPTTPQYFDNGDQVNFGIWEYVPGTSDAQIRLKVNHTIIVKRQPDGRFAIFNSGLPAKSPAAAVTKVTAPTTKFDSILATAIPELREAARIILDDSGVQLFNPSVYMEEEGAQIRIAISDPTDSFNEAGFIISKGIQYIGYRISPFHGRYGYAGGTALDYGKFIELVKEVLKKEKEHPYWGEWTTVAMNERIQSAEQAPVPVKEFATTGLTGKNTDVRGPTFSLLGDGRELTGPEISRLVEKEADFAWEKIISNPALHTADGFSLHEFTISPPFGIILSQRGLDKLVDRGLLSRISDISIENDKKQWALTDAGHQGLPLEKPTPAGGEKSDYADTGDFGQGSRNKLFGLETEPVTRTFGLVTVGEELVAPDLDAGLLNIPGARYYLWDGSKLRYFIAKGSEYQREFDAEAINPDNENAKLIEAALTKNKIGYPCYIFEFIPRSSGSLPILSENDRYFYAGDEKQAYATRLANMPVITLGLIKHNPYIALAKMAHERAAFEAKQQGKSGDEQHAAGLDAEFHSVELMNLKDKELSDEARKELINLLNNISEELIRLGNVRKYLEENKVFGKTGGDYSDSAPAEKEAALAKLLSIANVADKEILTDSVTWDNLLARFGISMAEETGLIISIDAVAEGLGAVLVGLANRDVSIYVVVDKNSEVQTKLLHAFNKRIPKEENKIEFTDSVADAAFNLEAYVGTESKIRYVGTDENIASLSEQFKKAFIITPVKRIIEHMGMLGFENLKTMFEDFQQSCVRLGLV